MRRHAKAIVAISAMLLTLALGASIASAAPPVPAMGTISAVSYASAHVTGTVDPAGEETYYSFERSTDGVNWSGFSFEGPIQPGEVQPGESKEVEADLTGLKGGTEYFIRLSALNFVESGEIHSPGPNLSFTTLPVDKPTVLATDDAADVSYTTAKVSGSVERPANPDPAFDASCRFEYVTGAQFSINGFEGASRTPCDLDPVTATGPTAVKTDLTGLNHSTTYHLRLAVENAGGVDSLESADTFTTLPVTAPSVSIDPVTTFTGTTAHFSGAVNPGAPVGNPPAFDVGWNFECTPGCPGLAGGSIPADSVSHTVEVNAAGLEPNTSYEVRLVATNLGGSQSAAASFKTELELSAVRTLPAAVITNSSAWIGGQINPKNSSTTYYIEYSANEDFSGSTSVPASLDASAGSANAFVQASRQVTGLAPSTTYYVRLHAESQAGPVVGDLTSFETLDRPRSNGLPDGRVWERVSPVDKKGGAISPGTITLITPLASRSQVSADGQAVTYSSAGKWDGDGGPPNSQYLGRRNSNGWSSEGISPTHYGEPGGGAFNQYVWFSDDLSTGVVRVSSALNPGDPKEGIGNLYVRDNTNGSYRTISNAPESTPEHSVIFEFETASLNGGHAVFGIKNGSLFERTPTGDILVVSILPDGTQARAQVGHGGDFKAQGVNAISADGSRIYFTASDPPETGALYLRENGASTTLVSSSERSGDDPAASRLGSFEGASSDGSVAFFTSREKLTEDSVAGIGNCGLTCSDLYRWDRQAPPGDRLTDLTTADAQGAKVRGTTLMSKDGSSVYFVADGKLVDGAVRGTPNLYLWRQGEGIRLVAEVGSADGGLWDKELGGFDTENQSQRYYREARISPDGRYLAFVSHASLTAYDTGGTAQIYLYDRDTEELSCVSCGTVFARSRANSFFLSAVGQSTRSEPMDYLTRNLSEDGSRLFFDSADALLPEDSNGVTDVYEWAGGKLYLLSSGTSERASRLFDAGANGDDVFFTTGQRLVRSDSDNLVDLYDARVDGMEEPPVVLPCVADECQGTPSPPPPFESPSSSTFSGQGDRVAKAKHPRHSCRKGKARRHGRCVKSKQSKGRNNREQGRGK